MPQVLVRNLDRSLVTRLKARARRHGRSLQAELKAILEEASGDDMLQARRLADRIRRTFSGRPQTDSGKLQAEDRRR